MAGEVSLIASGTVFTKYTDLEEAETAGTKVEEHLMRVLHERGQQLKVSMRLEHTEQPVKCKRRRRLAEEI